MTSYNSLDSPGKVFGHSRLPHNMTTTAPKRSLEREFSFKSPQRYRIDFDLPRRSSDHYESRYNDKDRKAVELEHNIDAIVRNNKDLAEENQEIKTLLLMQRNEIESLRAKGSRTFDTMLTQ